MREALVSIKTAKLAFEKGFDEPSYFYFWSDQALIKDITHSENFNGWKYGVLHKQKNFVEDDNIFTISVPSQSLLQRWLREKYNIEIWLGNYGTNPPYKYHAEDIIKDGVLVLEDSEMFDTFEEALEKGLYESLKLIK